MVGTTAWIVTTSPENGLLGVGLADPEHPYLSGVFALPADAQSITATGETILMASRHGGLMIVDVSDPSDPSLISSLEINAAAAIAADADHAYVATSGGSGGSAVYVVDISDATAPTVVSTVPYTYSASPQGLAIMNDRLILGLVDFDPMIAQPEGGFVVYDISSPTNPVETSYTPFSSGPHRFAHTGGTTVVADAERGLRVFSLVQSGVQVEVARRNVTLDDAFAVAVQGEFAYLGDQGLRVVHLADHANPTVVGSVELEGEIHSVAADPNGQRVAVLTDSGMFSLIDASSPGQPMIMSQGPTAGLDTAIQDNLVAVAEGADGLLLLDVSEPTIPTFRARIPTTGPALTVALDQGVAVVGLASDTTNEGTVAVFDISDPFEPILTAHLPASGGVYSLDINGSKVAALTRDSTMLIDISDLNAPYVIGSSDVRSGIPTDVALDGFLVSISSWSGSLYVIDFSSPAGPSVRAGATWDPLGFVDGGPQGGYGVALHNGDAVIADGRYGLRIIAVERRRPLPDPYGSQINLD